MPDSQILEGITVLDCSIAMAGPFAAQRLGDLGADVIKIEPVTGEWQRHTPAGGSTGKRINTSFLSLNRNKRSLAVDLKTAAGQKIIHNLVRHADVFLQNYRPGVAHRLKLDYDTLIAENPHLVYVSLSGYGVDGPYKDRPGQDLLLQAMSGAMLATGSAGARPQPAGQYLVDAITAYTAFEGALAALYHRERTGEGQHVEVNMLDAIIALQMQELSVFTVGHKPPTRSEQPHGHCYIRAPYGIFKTRDDKFLALAFPPLDVLAEALDAPELAAFDFNSFEPENRDAIFTATEQATLRYDLDELMRRFLDKGLWASPVFGYEDVVNDPQVKHNGSFVEYEHETEGHVKTPGFPIHFNKTPCRINRGAPLAGQHSRDVLSRAGFSDAEIDEFLADGVVVHES
ncbi:MAG: CoA transferase [Gammaproteobacteria bacterium]|nr:CoA transferase [Gammaproteobacteria bacterium]NNL99531.1 CoA transferase [Gammaproteobacteria bacterium]